MTAYIVNNIDFGHASGPTECSQLNICGLSEAAGDSEFDRFGFVDLSFYDDMAEMEQAAAALHDFEATTSNLTLYDLAGVTHQLYETAKNVDIRRYRAWVGERSLHIS